MTKFTRSRTGKIAKAASDTSCDPLGAWVRVADRPLPAGSMISVAAGNSSEPSTPGLCFRS